MIFLKLLLLLQATIFFTSKTQGLPANSYEQDYFLVKVF